MKTIRLILALVILALSPVDQIAAAESNCLTCHRDFEEDTGPSHKITRDVHFQKGLDCVSCHGGDPTLEDMDDVRESKGYRGVPDHREVPQFCASCHSDAAYMRGHNPALPTDQLQKYKTSVHGELLFGKNDSKVANCISCHTVHEIGSAKMPHSSTHPLNIPFTCGKCHSDADYMAAYDISTSQLDDYRASVHGMALLERQDLGAPACNDCHGNHGAAPPGTSSLSAVCGNCHALEAELYNLSPHKNAFEENDFPMCETCHSNHRIIKPYDAMVGSDDTALCSECHSHVDGTKGLETAEGISMAIAELVAAHDQAREVLEDAIEKGMMTTDEEFRLKEVDQLLIQTRTLVHSYSLDSVLPKAEAGIQKADSVKTNSASLIDEYYFRRKGLGIATLFITLLALALWLKIRRL
ncbi:MAG: cytochrome c3 family protein [bacterium]|nr:cytochrome c3 family protein [bacterium]